MNDDLISRSAFLERMMRTNRYFDVKFDIMEEPAVDAVIPVRCKDCEHYINAHDDGLMYCMRPIFSEDYNETGYIFPLEEPMRETDFCSYGKRRTGK